MILIWLISILILGSNAARDDYYEPSSNYEDSGAPRNPPPAILTHKQAVTNDGVFNYVFAADNGLKQGESISPDGTRTGAYEYVDPSGKTISVKYTAGKDGFKIIEGDHIPTQPEAYKPNPKYQPPEYREDYRERAEEQEQRGKIGSGKYKTDVKYYDQPEEERGYRNQDQREQERYQQGPPRQNQRYTNQQPRPKVNAPSFKPSHIQDNQPDGRYSGGQQNQRRAQSPRAMLINVEQRHSANYRRYQDNGQPVDGSNDGGQDGGQGAAPHHFSGGYNFEFKG